MFAKHIGRGSACACVFLWIFYCIKHKLNWYLLPTKLIRSVFIYVFVVYMYYCCLFVKLKIAGGKNSITSCMHYAVSMHAH